MLWINQSFSTATETLGIKFFSSVGTGVDLSKILRETKILGEKVVITQLLRARDWAPFPKSTPMSVGGSSRFVQLSTNTPSYRPAYMFQ